MKKISLRLKISFSILIPLVIMLVFANVVNIVYVRTASKGFVYQILNQSAAMEVESLKSIINDEADITVGFANTVAGFYKDGVSNRNFYEAAAYNFFGTLPKEVNKLLIAFEPNIFNDDNNYLTSEKYMQANGRFNYYVTRDGDNLIDGYSDNTIFQSDYYTSAVASKENYITDIYTSSSNNNKAMNFIWSIPIKADNRVIGVVAIDVSVESLYNLLSNIKLFEGTTTTLFDNKGLILYDSDKDYFIGKTLDEIYPYYQKFDMFNKVMKNEVVIFQTYSQTVKENYTYSFTPVDVMPGKNWGLKITAPNRVIFKDSNEIRTIMIIISIVIVVLAFLIVPYIIGRTVSSIITVLAKDIVGMSTGDLTIEIPKGFENRKDEWGDIARGWDKAMLNFNKVVHTVRNSAEQVSTAANQVLSGNTDLSHRTESQAASLEETASSMNQMASAIKESAEGVARSTQMVADAKNSLMKAGVIVEDSVEKMNDVYEASEKIINITKLIEDIAFQTNILALNASVEAARAGEQGRGFAVVASEVRNLAQNAQESVKNITDLITDSTNKINLATRSVKESKEMFDDISQKMDDASAIMEKINIAAQEQGRGISQVNIAITQMDTSVQQNAALVEEATSASQSLLNEAEDLIKAIEYFKLKEE